MRQKIIKYILSSIFLLAGGVAYAQPANNSIFRGGEGDGWAFGSNNLLPNNIFRGGIGDGWSFASNDVAANNIFVGGAGDGWSFSSNNATPNNIFLGGQGDGWSFSSNNATPNSIFRGGRGDGWSARVIPLSPLPVTLLSFTAAESKGRHILRWETSQEHNSSYFDVLQSSESSNFYSLGKVAAAGESTVKKAYEFTVDNPLSGNNFYRLRQVDKDGKFEWSNIILLKLLSDNSLLTVFPNPTADVLHFSFSGAQSNSQVSISFYNTAGAKIKEAVLQKTNSRSEIIVKDLKAGMYIIRVVDKGEVSTFKILKQ